MTDHKFFCYNCDRNVMAKMIEYRMFLDKVDKIILTCISCEEETELRS